ncbi:MAG TPA: hypothetical protein VE993_05615 [Stellaceae bacterium]|nr:hypothetical protein [Stellaceae bacterium]
MSACQCADRDSAVARREGFQLDERRSDARRARRDLATAARATNPSGCRRLQLRKPCRAQGQDRIARRLHTGTGDVSIGLDARDRLAPDHVPSGARVEGKSSLARLGLGVHLTAPTIHAGFKGQIQLEIVNFGPHEIILNVGMPICQLIFELTFGTPAKGYIGHFAAQVSDPGRTL